MSNYTEEDWGDPENGHACTVWHAPASAESIATVMSAPVTDGTDEMDGRSGFRWFRFPDGTLVLGVFPQGDIYTATEGDHST